MILDVYHCIENIKKYREASTYTHKIVLRVFVTHKYGETSIMDVKGKTNPYSIIFSFEEMQNTTAPIMTKLLLPSHLTFGCLDAMQPTYVIVYKMNVSRGRYII